MRKLIASINMTLDGFCDHTAVIADDELHENATALFRSADIVLFGRITYQLMKKSWPAIAKNPTGHKAVDEFAVLMDNIPKLVFSQTLKEVTWKNTRLAAGNIKDEVLKLKKQTGKNILAGSPTIITTLMQLGLVDEYQFCVQPIVLGNGLPLFRDISSRINLHLLQTKNHASGAVTFFYRPAK